MAGLIFAAHGVHAIVVDAEIVEGGFVCPVYEAVAIKGVGNGRDRGPCVAAGVGGEFLHVGEGGHDEGRVANAGGVRAIMNQPVAVFHVVDHVRGVLGDGIKVAQAHAEVDHRGRLVGGGIVNAEGVSVGIAQPQLVDQQAQG